MGKTFYLSEEQLAIIKVALNRIEEDIVLQYGKTDLEKLKSKLGV